jgi:hypothetical protein
MKSKIRFKMAEFSQRLTIRPFKEAPISKSDYNWNKSFLKKAISFLTKKQFI